MQILIEDHQKIDLTPKIPLPVQLKIGHRETFIPDIVLSNLNSAKSGLQSKSGKAGQSIDME